MSSHDLSLSSINKTAPVKTDTKTAAVEKTESEGFVEELKEVMGLKEKDDAKKTTVDEKGDVEKGEAAEKSKESESVETKEETTEEKVSQGSELLSRLDQANSTLVDKKAEAKKESDDKESSDDSEPLSDAEVMLTQASIAAKGETNSSKTVAEKTDPLKEIQWGSSAKSSTQVEGETQSKGEASGNKESTKELLTSTALIGKAEAEAGKLAEAKKAKIDISALGMTQVANGETVNLTEAKTTDSFAQQLATASGATATQQVTAAQKMDPAMAPLNIRQEQVSDEVAERINMMMAKNLKHVDIRLDPPEMGRMHIRLNMGADSAGVQFTVSNQQARDAIEQSLPRLREMFAQQGIQLADTSVQQQNSGESSQYAYQKEESSRQGSGFNEEFSEEKEINVQVSKPNDGISFYA
ncbi:flagellar hook-length control protein FliK [Aliivibrio sp. S4TY2]|uniref:flagellar hook-length control protein FliK n=1 Tax=unclassified Aliivibrio TaxID=2645654 RepID=UPI002378C870|nr:MULTISPECIES: flagellar hook-length control protein FliK [unclassified Aliivibrio]MDD9154774.1 flagellar hook-length control protein FliK [Aliivibrio sp. S4TY2]MDD9158863.1 flagellar hook-length control protein FliK [Aliivibrio sp. S4TY1]MDD9162777.1 flagellar hook-length control protein FliK [Aliivibrio sp. S4MY2]MDD9166862.1 flagellar hook-length control protein FliK [Aliivibrio sp. S4MY4]MDD9183854.1 flagellar hook-length control protein FliK [Aliivibrio sp. S4MY3]